LSDRIKENETDGSSDNYARQQKYVLGFGFSPGGGGGGARMGKTVENTQLEGWI